MARPKRARLILWGFHPAHDYVVMRLIENASRKEQERRLRDGWTIGEYLAGDEPAGLRLQAKEERARATRSNPYVSDADLFDRDALIESLRKRGMSVAAATRRADEMIRGTLKANPEAKLCRYCHRRAIGVEPDYGATPTNVCGQCAHAGATVHLFSGDMVTIPYTSSESFRRGLGISAKLKSRDNPGLLLWTGNPPHDGRVPDAVVSAWEEFHQREGEGFSGTIRNVGPIRGAPAYGFACGRLGGLDVGDGDQTLSRGGVWVVCCGSSKKLWIVSEREPMDFAGMSGRRVHALTYVPTASSGKDRCRWKHEFSEPLPTLAPVGPANRCRAVKLDGGAYEVREWLYD